jgi:hypothetical protein
MLTTRPAAELLGQALAGLGFDAGLDRDAAWDAAREIEDDAAHAAFHDFSIDRPDLESRGRMVNDPRLDVRSGAHPEPGQGIQNSQLPPDQYAAGPKPQGSHVRREHGAAQQLDHLQVRGCDDQAGLRL